MRTLDPIKQYLGLQERLRKEKADIEQRLIEINRALNHEQDGKGAGSSRGGRPRGKRMRNEMSLKDAILQVIRARPLNRKEILQEVQRMGYRFGSTNPLNTLGATLYGNKKIFRNNGGKFSPVK